MNGQTKPESNKDFKMFEDFCGDCLKKIEREIMDRAFGAGDSQVHCKKCGNHIKACKCEGNQALDTLKK